MLICCVSCWCCRRGRREPRWARPRGACCHSGAGAAGEVGPGARGILVPQDPADRLGPRGADRHPVEVAAYSPRRQSGAAEHVDRRQGSGRRCRIEPGHVGVRSLRPGGAAVRASFRREGSLAAVGSRVDRPSEDRPAASAGRAALPIPGRKGAAVRTDAGRVPGAVAKDPAVGRAMGRLEWEALEQAHPGGVVPRSPQGWP